MKKWMVRIGAVLVIFLLILLTAPLMFKGKILTAAKQAASESVMAKIDFDDDLNLSLIRNFPNLSVGVNNLKIVGVDSFQTDTLFQSKELRLVVDISTLFGDNESIGLSKIYVNEPRVKVHVLPSGRGNYDIVPAEGAETEITEEETTESSLSLDLNHIEITNANIIYHDASMGVDFVSNSSDFIAEGSYKGDIFNLISTFKSKEMNVSYEGLTAISKASFNLESSIEMDLGTFRFDIESMNAKLNELPLNMKGWLQLNDENMEMDLAMDVPSSEFKSLLSAVPGCYTQDFNQVQASGKMNFSMVLKGIMDEVKMPSSEIKMGIQNAQFHYPDLPKSVTNINMDLLIENKDGDPDQSILDLKTFSLKLGEDLFEMSLYSKNPVSNPYAKGNIKAGFDLDQWNEYLPLDSTLAVSGKIASSISFEGHYASVENQNINDLKAEGSLKLEEFNFFSEDILPLNINYFEITANPHSFKVAPSKITYGQSTIEVKEGTLDNAIAFALNDEMLHGRLKIHSDKIDLNEWIASEDVSPEETSEAKDSSTLEAVSIPHNLDLEFSGSIGQLIYEDYDLRNCQAVIKVSDGRLIVDPIKANLWGSQFNFSTTYAYEEGGKPHLATSFALQNLVPRNVGNSFRLLQTYAPIMKKFDAPFNLNMKMNSDLDQNMSPIMQDLSADGLAKVSQATKLESPEWLNQVFEQLKWGKENVKEVKIKPGTLGFAIQDGQLKLKDSIRLDVYKGSNMAFTGGVDLDQNLDFNGHFYTQGKAVPVRITGTTTSPKLSIDWKKLGLQVVEEYKEKAVEKVKEEVKEISDNLIEKAEQKAEELRNAAAEKAQVIRDKGREAADRQRAETDRLMDLSREETDKKIGKMIEAAKNPIERLAAEKAAKALRKKSNQKIDRLKKEGYKKASQIETEANKKADAIESAARNESEKLIQEAQEKQKQHLN